MYKNINKPELKKGIKFWVNKQNRFGVLMLHYTADPLKDPERNGKEWFKNEKLGTPKATWLKEYEIDFTTKSGKLIFGPEYCDFDPKIHLINSFELPEPYELLLALDFGQRNPTCGLIGAWTAKNELYIIDEYYKPALPSVSSREMFTQFEYLMGGIGVLDGKSIRQKRIIATNTFTTRVIDPTTVSKNRTKVREGEEIEYSVIEEFEDHGWDFEPGKNNVESSITRIREYLQLDENQKAHLYIFKDKCPYLSWEMQHYRYKELSEIQGKTHNESEEPVKKDDHGIDGLRYLISTRPNTPQRAPLPKTRVQKDINNLLKPKVFNDWDIN